MFSSNKISCEQFLIIWGASPPVAMILQSSPASARNLSSIPSSIHAVPNITPERMQSTVLVRIALFGARRSTAGRSAPLFVSASSEIPTPGAIAPPRYALLLST